MFDVYDESFFGLGGGLFIEVYCELICGEVNFREWGCCLVVCMSLMYWIVEFDN